MTSYDTFAAAVANTPKAANTTNRDNESPNNFARRVYDACGQHPSQLPLSRNPQRLLEGAIICKRRDVYLMLYNANTPEWGYGLVCLGDEIPRFAVNNCLWPSHSGGTRVDQRALAARLGYPAGSQFRIVFEEKSHRDPGETITYRQGLTDEGRANVALDKITGVEISHCPISAGAVNRLCRKAEAGTGIDELEEAVRLAPWGANGALFVTSRSHWPHNTGRTKTVWVNRIPVVEYTRYGNGNTGITQIPRDVGIARRDARRDRNRHARDSLIAAQAACDASLSAYGVTDKRDHGHWGFVDGCNGGVFSHPDYVHVPADGALRRVKHDTVDEYQWDRRLYGARW